MKKLSLNQKLVLVLACSAVLATLYVGYSQNVNDRQIQFNQNRTDVINKFIADLENIKRTAPNNIYLSDCLAEQSRHIDFSKKYEECYSRIKQHGIIPNKIIESHISSLSLYLTESEADSINPLLDELYFFLYEMENNQLTLETWSNNMCPARISFYKPEEFKILFEEHEGCALALQNFDKFLESNEIQDNDDSISGLQQRQESIDNIKAIIAPGDDMEMWEYTLSLNAPLYNEMLIRCDLLVGKFKTILRL